MAAGRPASPPVREHQLVLDSFRQSQVRSYLQGDARNMLEYLGDTARLMPGYQKAVLGKADATVYHQAFLKRFAVTAYQRQAIEAVDLGQRVMEIGRFTMTLSPRSPAAQGASEAHTVAGKYMDLWEKTAAGKLLLNTAAWNYDQLPKIGILRCADVPAFHGASARVP